MKSTSRVTIQKLGRTTYRVSVRNGRSALTGRFISKAAAQRHPTTTTTETRGMAPDRIVVPNPEGGWDVKGGGKRASAHTDTQAQAIQRAKEIVRNQGGGEVSISGRDGKIRAKDTVDPGNDPRNIPG